MEDEVIRSEARFCAQKYSYETDFSNEELERAPTRKRSRLCTSKIRANCFIEIPRLSTTVDVAKCEELHVKVLDLPIAIIDSFLTGKGVGLESLHFQEEQIRKLHGEERVDVIHQVTPSLHIGVFTL